MQLSLKRKEVRCVKQFDFLRLLCVGGRRVCDVTEFHLVHIIYLWTFFYCLKSQTRAAATMSVTAAASGFVVLLLTVTGTVRLHSCCHSVLHSDF